MQIQYNISVVEVCLKSVDEGEVEMAVSTDLVYSQP